MSGLAIGADVAARYYRIDSAAGMDALSIGFTAGTGGGARIGVVGGILPYVEQSVAAGQTVVLPLSILNQSRPFDIFVAGTGGATTGTLRVGQLDVPDFIDPGLLTNKKIDLAGDVAPSSRPVGAFGDASGIKFYQLLTTPNQFTNLSIRGSAGAVPLFAQYEESGGQLKPKRYEIADASGAVSSSTPLKGDHLHAVNEPGRADGHRPPARPSSGSPGSSRSSATARRRPARRSAGTPRSSIGDWSGIAC